MGKGRKSRKGRKGKRGSGAGRNEFREILGYGKLGEIGDAHLLLTYCCTKVAIRSVWKPGNGARIRTAGVAGLSTSPFLPFFHFLSFLSFLHFLSPYP